MQRWNEVVYAKSKQQFKDLYILLKMDYSDQPLLMQYLEDNKYPLRHLFTQAWTNEIRHYGHIVTSRIEKRHDVVKKFIGTSKYDLFKVVKVIEDCYKVQFSELRMKLSMARDRVPHRQSAKSHH